MKTFVTTNEGKAHLGRMTKAAAIHNRKNPVRNTPKRIYSNREPVRVNGELTPYGIVLNTMRKAKRRCTNEKDRSYKNYGGRGIKFLFDDPYTAADWVIANIGYRPSAEYSIDRIDNCRHYEAGNLRWATRSEQANNKRAYKRRAIGERIRKLQQQGCNFSYETIRTWIKEGKVDAEILSRQHSGAGRPRKPSTDL